MLFSYLVCYVQFKKKKLQCFVLFKRKIKIKNNNKNKNKEANEINERSTIFYRDKYLIQAARRNKRIK